MCRKPFYKDGIRFECQGDGKCCVTRGRYSYVYLSFGDRKRMAAFLGLSMAEFRRQHTQASSGGRVYLKNPEQDCQFLEDNRCSVYKARPWQCRTWPFWPENMHPKVWERDVAGYCPGVGKGRLFTAEEIEDILAKRRDLEETDAETGRRGDAE